MVCLTCSSGCSGKSDPVMIIPSSQITGTVLAGGRSSRFGSNKALAMIDGHSFLHKSLEILKPFCSRILISGNYTEYEEYGYPIVKDIISELGPMGGIYTALKQAETPYTLFLTCDMPAVTGQLLEQLLEDNNQDDIAVWQQENGTLQLFPSLFDSSVLPVVERHVFNHQLSIRSLFDEVTIRKIPIRKEDEPAFRNINHIADLNI